MNGHCKECQYWAPHNENSPYNGYCHRFPPAHLRKGLDNLHDETYYQDWCGEFVGIPQPLFSEEGIRRVHS